MSPFFRVFAYFFIHTCYFAKKLHKFRGNMNNYSVCSDKYTKFMNKYAKNHLILQGNGV